MNTAHTLSEIRAKHEQGHDLLREEVEMLFNRIDKLDDDVDYLEGRLADVEH